jgi:nucleotide-binding universal stress UspA family protein
MEVSRVHFKHILYATDFSENAEYACSYAKSVADQYNAEITLLHVIKEELPDFMIFDAGMDRTSKEVSNRLTMQKELDKEQKAQIISRIEEEYSEKTGIKRYIIEKGNPVKIIIKTVEEEACDLIVMGFKGRSTFEDFLMGDTIRHVISKVKIPVLVVQNQSKK